MVYLPDSTSTATVIELGPLGVPNIEAVAKDPVTQILYGANANTLGTINLDTGAYASLGSFGTALAANGDLTANVALSDVDSLSFSPITGNLFGVQNSGNGAILFQINTATGALVPGVMGGGNDYLIVTGGAIDDIAIDTTGEMYSSLATRLAEIDYTAVGTTATTIVGNFGGGISDMEGLSFDVFGNLIGTTGTGGAATANSLWQVDTLSGTASSQVTPGVRNDYEGVACYHTQVDIELSKTVALTTDADGSGYFSTGDTVRYDIAVTNTHPTSLVSAVAVTDDLSGLAGLAFVSSTDNKPVGSSYDETTGLWSVGVIPANTTYTLSVFYTLGATAVPLVINTAQVTAAANSDPDSTVDNDTGNQSEDDEDRATVHLNPQIGALKSASVGALNVDGTFNVTYTVVIENTGGAELSSLTLVDELSDPTQLGTAFNGVVSAPVISLIKTTSGNTVAPTTAGAAFTGTGSGTALLLGTDGTLGLGDQYQVEFTVSVNPNAGSAPANLDNTIIATGTPPGGTAVSDNSDTGTDATGIPTGDTPATNPGGPGSPTPITPPAATPEIGVVKSLTALGSLQSDGTFDATYTALVENTGDVRLTNLTLTDNLSATTQLGTAFNGIVSAPVVSLLTNSSGNAVAPGSSATAFTGTGTGTALLLGSDGTLDPGDQYQVVFVINIDPSAASAPAALDNTLTTTGTPPSGSAVTDNSNTGTNAAGATTGELPSNNPGGPGTPTPLTPPTPAPEIGVVKSISNISAPHADGTFDVTYTLLIENTGNQSLGSLTLTDDLSDPTQLGSAFNGIISPPVVSLITNTSTKAIAPTTNGAGFTGDGTGTNLLLGTDGQIEPGDQYQVVFIANIDPSATGAPAALDNTATAGASPPSGATISDNSNTGTDAGGAATGELPSDNPGGPGTPTPVTPPALNPELGIVKSATTIGALQIDGTFDVTYTLLIENTGDVILTPLTLVDDLNSTSLLGSAFNGVTTAPAVTLATNSSGNAVAPSTTGAAFTGTGAGTALITGTDGRLDPSDQFQVVFTVNIDPSATGAPANLNNSATAGGTPPTGTAVTDTSNTGTDATGTGTGERPQDNPGGPGTPTPVAPPAINPEIGVIKSATNIGALQVDGTFDVTYTVLVENTGNVRLTSLVLTDDLSATSQLGTTFAGVTSAPVVSLATNTSGNAVAPTTSGAAFTGTGSGTALVTGSDGVLDPGDQYQVVFAVTIDANATGAPATLDNTVTASGTPPTGSTVTDLSNTGTDATGVATGELPTDNPDGPGSPTPVTPPAATAELGIVKSATTIGALQSNGTFDVTYTLLVENTGNQTLNSLTLIDDVNATAQLGTAFNGVISAPVVSLVNNASGNAVAPTSSAAVFTGTGAGTALVLGTDGRLDPADQYQVVFAVNVNPNATGAPAALNNNATAGGTPPSGTAVTDTSNTGTTAGGGNTGEVPADNPGGPGTPTPVTPPVAGPQIGVVKSATTIGAGKIDGTFDVTYTLLIENTGDVTLTPLALTDDMANVAQLGSAFDGVVTAPVVSIVSNASGNAVAPSTNGVAFSGTGAGTGLITGSDGRLDPNDQYQVVVTIAIDPNAAGAPTNLLNIATASGTPPSGTDVTDQSNTGTDISGTGTGEIPADNPGGPGNPTPVTPPSSTAQIGVVKSATTIGAAQTDGTFDVTYTLLVENTGNTTLTPLTLVDDLRNASLLGSAFNGVTIAPSVTLVANNSGNAVAPTTSGAAFSGTGAGTALIIGSDGRLDPTDQYQVVFSVNIDPNAASAPTTLNNSATAGGTPPSGTQVTDNSNTGTDLAGLTNGEVPGNNPGGPGTPTPVAPPADAASIGVVKSAIVIGSLQSNGTFDVTYRLLVENTGDVVLTNLALNDDLAAATQLGSAFNGVTVAPAVFLTTNASGNAVAPTTAGTTFTGTGAGTALVVGSDGRLESGDQYSVTFTVNIAPNAAGAPAALNNLATTAGTPPSGTPVTDDSNTGSDGAGNGTGENPGDNPNGPGSPTVVIPPVGNPQVGLTKSVTAIGDAQNDGSFDVSYRLVIENTGDVALTNLTLVDDLSASTQLGTAFVGITSAPTVSLLNNASGNAIAPTSNGAGFTGTGSGTNLLTGTDGRIEPGDQYAVLFSATINANIAGAPAELTNTANTGGRAPDATVVTDNSNTGTDNTGAPTGELPGDNPGGPGSPTPVVPPNGLSQIGLTKGVTAVGPLLPDGSFDVTYRLLVRNTGATTLTELRLDDSLESPTTLGTAFNNVVSVPVVELITNLTGTSIAPISRGIGFTGRAGGTELLTGNNSSLAPNDEYAVTFSVNIDPNATDAPSVLNNIATANGTPESGGTPVTDDSNTSTDAQGNNTGETPTDNPGGPGSFTPVTPPQENPAIGLAKRATIGGLLADGTFDVTFTLVAENTGDVQLSSLTLIDELSAASNLGSAFVGLRTAPSITLNNNSGNSVEPALNPNYTGTNTDPAILQGTNGLLVPGDSYEITLTATINASAPGAPAELTNQGFAGGTSPAGAIPTDASDNGSQTSGPNNEGSDADPTPIGVPSLTVLVVSKSTATPSVVAGGFASYIVNVTNPGAFEATGVTLSDDLPGGFSFVNDSAELLRAGVSAAAVTTGLDPVVTDIGSLAAGETVSLSYLLRVGAGVVTGEHTNTAAALVFGTIASNEATASVTLAEDPLASTTRVLGKVFNDRDGDGWQDAAWATGMRLSGGPFSDASNKHRKLENLPGRLSDSDIDSAPRQRIAIPKSWGELEKIKLTTKEGTVLFINKNGAIESKHRGQKKRGLTAQDIQVELVSSRLNARNRQRNDYLEITNVGINETGIPGVRLATVEGLVIETDQYGRYHIEDINNVAWDIGSNFIVKIDPQSLPQSAEFTTENPRVERLTQGLASNIDFGVRIPEAQWAAFSCPAPITSDNREATLDTSGVTLRTEPLTVIRFESGKSAISASQIGDIKRGMERFRGSQNLRLRFSGHTDNQPLSARAQAIYGDNQGLSESRAKQVAQRVTETLGLNDNEVVLAGFGDNMPVAGNGSAAGMALNRRVTVEATFEIPAPIQDTQISVAAKSVEANCIPQAISQVERAPTALTIHTEVQPVQISEAVTETISSKVSEIRFRSGNSAINQKDLQELDRQLSLLWGKDNLRVRFTGHTDNERLGPRTASLYGSNQGLSEARAREVAEQVQQLLGISSSMVEIAGHGDSLPQALNTTPEGMAQNRRVEIELIYDETTGGQPSVAGASTTTSPTVEKSVAVQSFAASSKPTHGVVRAIEDQTQIDPRLAVVATYDYLPEGTQAVKFHRYTNYPAFINTLTLEIYQASDIDLTRPIAVIDSELNGQLDVTGGMIWNTTALRAGERFVYVLKATGANGETDTTHPRTLDILPADKINREAEPVDAMSIYGTSALAQQTIPVTGGRIRVWGLDLATSHTLTVAGEYMPLDDNGNFALEAHLPQGTYSLPVVNRNPAGPAMQQNLNVEVSDSYLFMVGIANVTFGGNNIDDLVEPIAADDRYTSDTYTTGRLAFYLKGKIKGKYLITAQLDSTEDELKNFGDNLQRRDPRSIFRRLEADQYYPVYGDDSTTRKDTESIGAGYVRINWNKSQALWGNFETGITGNEFAQYNRSLYGAQLAYRTNAVTEHGDNRVAVTAFASEPQSVAAHNEFEATGGSLYYLRQTDVVRGSEKVWIEIRRRDTLQVIDQLALQPGEDYEFDHIQGRILLNRPLSQITPNRNDAIIRDQGLEGDRVFLVANYEFVPTGFDNDNLSSGVRGQWWISSALGLGGTYINEARSGNDYTLAGGDLTWRHGKGTYVKLEAATSESNQTVSLFSGDGGLTFNSITLPTGATSEGDAFGIEARLNLADISEHTGILRAWYKDRESGFSSSRETLQGTDTTDIGFEADVQIGKRYKVIAKGNQLEREDLSEDTIFSLQGEMRVNNRLDVGVEVRDEQREVTLPGGLPGAGTISADATLFGLRAKYKVTPKTDVYVEGQTSTGESAAFESNDRIAVGVQTRINEALGLGVEVSEGDRGSALIGSVDYRISDSLALDIGAGFGDGAYGTAGATINLDNGYQLYGSYGIDPDSTIDRQRNVTTIGQRLALGNGSKLFHEHQWSRSDAEDGVTNVFGLEYFVNEYTSISGTIQKGELDFAGVTTQRDAVSLGAAIQRDSLRLGSRVEWRRDEGPVNEFEQWLSSNSVELKSSESLRWVAKANYSETEDKLTGDTAARLAEGNIGFAYRPVWTNRWNVLGRYTYLSDLVAPQQVQNRPDQRSHVASVEGLYNLNNRWEFGMKLAARRGQIRAGRDSGPWFNSGLDLAIARARYHMTHKWDGLLEYRWVSNSKLDDVRSGALAGIYRHFGKRVKFGLGYNFTDYSDDLTNLDYDNGGWFVDVIGKW